MHAHSLGKLHFLTFPSLHRPGLPLVFYQVCLFELLSIFVLFGTASASYNGLQIEPHSVPLEEIALGGPPRDGIPALLSPKFIPSQEVDFLSSEDRVLGIQSTHQAKAYPIAILNWHEIVNDILEGTPVVITYCPLCGTGMGFQRTVSNRLLTFGVSGLLYQSDVLMYDHQTKSLWSQIARQAVTGQSLGEHLEPIFLEHTTWKAWRKRHPHTLVLSRQTGYPRDYSRDPYKNYALTDTLMFSPARQDNRLSPKQWILGVEIGGKFKAYSFSTLERLDQDFPDTFNGKNYVVCWDSQTRSAKVLNQQANPCRSLRLIGLPVSPFIQAPKSLTEFPKWKRRDSQHRSMGVTNDPRPKNKKIFIRTWSL